MKNYAILLFLSVMVSTAFAQENTLNFHVLEVETQDEINQAVLAQTKTLITKHINTLDIDGYSVSVTDQHAATVYLRPWIHLYAASELVTFDLVVIDAANNRPITTLSRNYTTFHQFDESWTTFLNDFMVWNFKKENLNRWAESTSNTTNQVAQKISSPMVKTAPKIKDIQLVLREKGYDIGEIDNVFGAKTKRALIRFQKDNGLSIGMLDIDTLEALGFSF